MNKAFAFLLLLIGGLSFSSLRAQPAGGVAPPTTQQLQAMIDEKKYADVIKESQRMLRLKGAAAKEFDKFDVLMLRAEAFLQNKQQSGAVESYREAAKEANDPTRAGLPRAMIKLISSSKALVYTPKPTKDPTKPASPLNLLDQNERKLALNALFEEEWKPTQAKIDALKKKSTGLQPILDAASLAGEIRGLEIAATGSDAQSSTALSDLTGSAAKMMLDYLDGQTKRVEAIDRAANLPLSDNITENSRRGLTAAQNTELRETLATCQKLHLAAQQVAASAGPKGSEFKAIAEKAEDLGKRSHELLVTDFTSYQDPNANRPVIRGNERLVPQPNNPQRRGY
jgi:hypothetical protein